MSESKQTDSRNLPIPARLNADGYLVIPKFEPVETQPEDGSVPFNNIVAPKLARQGA